MRREAALKGADVQRHAGARVGNDSGIRLFSTPLPAGEGDSRASLASGVRGTAADGHAPDPLTRTLLRVSTRQVLLVLAFSHLRA